MNEELPQKIIPYVITHGGGEVVSTPGAHGITLIPPEVHLISNDEVYSTEYIKDCCTRNKLLDLKPYRLNTMSHFPDNFDVMDVMLKYTSWSAALTGLPYEKSLYPYITSSPSDSSCYSDDEDFELAHPSASNCDVQPHVQKKQKIVRQIGSCDSESELENSKDSRRSKEIARKEDNRTSKASRPKVITENEYTDSRPSKWGFNSCQSSKKIYPKASQKVLSSSSEAETISEDELWGVPVLRSKKTCAKLRRRDYIHKERQAIISFISKHQYHNYVKGREIWQKAEAAQVCPGRTWQSMKEHFIKKIIPNIKTYHLSEEEIYKFQKPFH
ncbi:hypothetical protein B7P43_G07011 [Cryptotermes secundus]|uniref:Telomeric repeat-binding factor 2-interacting protein 1 n=1 Tax=Cryptotermes secundus TaxID=105785 RepID=A0A2J7PEN4_9NEOP|nr:hypothetical protein B7P43_G07011 [Cryptotermes secundus]